MRSDKKKIGSFYSVLFLNNYLRAKKSSQSKSQNLNAMKEKMSLNT